MNFLQHVCNLKIVHIVTFQVVQKQRNEQILLQATEKEEIFVLSATVTEKK